MWVTPRDLEILARVHDAHACDSAALADLFPTAKALQQCLWRLSRERYLKVHRVGNQRAYSLGRRGVQTLGLPAKEVRVSRAAAARYLLYARVRRQLLAEGWEVDGQDQMGRTTVIRAWRNERRIAVAICHPNASTRAAKTMMHKLRSLVNPFDPLADELVVFGPARAARNISNQSVPYCSRITIQPFPPIAQLDF